MDILDIFHIPKKRGIIWGIIFLGCEDYMTMWNAVWKSPWLPSVGSMCYVIYFSGTWKQSLDQGEPGLLPWFVLESDLASTQQGLVLSNSSSQADAPYTSFGSEVTFFLLPSTCNYSFLHPVCQPLPEEASMHVGTLRVLDWKQKWPSPGKDVLGFFLIWTVIVILVTAWLPRPAPLPGQQVANGEQKRAARNYFCCLFLPEKMCPELPAGRETPHHYLLQSRDWRWETAYSKGREDVG